jgi:hypothetical protein
MKTRTQLVARALQKIKVVGAGQDASARDATMVNDIVEPLMADLGVRGVYAAGDYDEIPDEAFEHLALLLGNAAAPDFGKEASEEVRIAGERLLRQQSATALSGEVLKVEYF